MDKETDNIYTFEIDGERESRGIAIPRRNKQLREYNAEEGEEVASDEISGINNISSLSGKNRRQVMQGLGGKRAEHLKKLYDSITSMNKGKVTTSFTKQGMELAVAEEPEADFVPFQCYWPTYETMSEAQKKWYLYWRGRIRADEYPDTDLSYLFLYIYEIINNIGISNPKEGFSILCRLWSSYRDRFPSMDRYMVPWLQDYIAVYKSGDMTEVFGLMPDKSLMSLFPDYMVLKFIGMADVELPVEFINRFSDYKFYLSKFFKTDEDNLLLKFIPLIFKEIDAHLVKETGKCIFESFRPEVIPWQSRLPFTNAVYYGDVKSIPVERFSYTEHRPLRDFFTAIIKHTENKLRAKKSFKGRLRGYELDKAVEKVIDEFIEGEFRKEEAARNYIKIEVDRDKILQLIYDSEIVKQRLLDGIGQEGEPQPSATDQTVIKADNNTLQKTIDASDYTAPSNADIQNFSVINQKDMPPFNNLDSQFAGKTGQTDSNYPVIGATGNEDSFGAFVGSLGEKEKEMVCYLAGHDFEVKESELEKIFAGLFLQNIIDNINTAAMDYIGDIMIVCEGGSWIVCDDYQEDLAKVFEV